MLSRLFGRKDATTGRTTQRRVVRLRMESLEAREVPAVYFWNPEIQSIPDPLPGEDEEVLNPFARVAYNWVNDAGERYDEPPGTDDDLVFTNLPYNDSHPNFPTSTCRITSASPSSFQSITILAGYGGPVSIERVLTVGTFVQRGGYVAQVGGGLDFYVTNAFTFTGGTLNSTSTLGTVHLQGATGTINLNGSAVELGSTLNVEARNGIGSYVELEPGTLSLANAAWIVVNSLCQFKLPERPGQPQVVIQPKQGTEPGVFHPKGANSVAVLDQGLNQKIGLKIENQAKLTVLKSMTVSGFSQSQLPG